MPRYSAERKAALLKLLPPSNLSVTELARQEGISEVTLYAWHKQAKAEGAPAPGDKKLPDDCAAEAKFAVVLETAARPEIELSEYCRRKGLYPEQVQTWRQVCTLASSLPRLNDRPSGSRPVRTRSGSANWSVSGAARTRRWPRRRRFWCCENPIVYCFWRKPGTVASDLPTRLRLT